MDNNNDAQTCESCVFFDLISQYWEPYPINYCKKYKKELGQEAIEPNDCKEYVLQLNS